MKEYLNRLPEFQVMETWDDSSKDLIILLPLFRGSKHWFPEYLIRVSQWVRHSFITNTDVIEKRIPVKWFVEKAFWGARASSCDELPYHEQCIFFNPAHWDIYRGQSRNRISKSLYAFWHEKLSEYKQVIIWDCDLFVCRKEGFPKLDIETLMSDNPETIDLLWWLNRYDQKYMDKVWWWAKFDPPDNVHKDFRQMLPLMNSLLPHDKQLSAASLFPHVSGGVKRFSPAHVPQEFVDFAKKAEPLICDEENIFHLWHRLTGYEYGLIEPKPFAWTAEQLMKYRDDGIYYSHIYEKPEVDPKGWEEQFHADIKCSSQ